MTFSLKQGRLGGTRRQSMGDFILDTGVVWVGPEAISSFHRRTFIRCSLGVVHWSLVGTLTIGVLFVLFSSKNER